MTKKIKSKEKSCSIKKIEVSGKLNFDFQFFKFKSVKFENFTNYVKDKDSAIKIINKFFMEIEKNIATDELINKKHTHKITEENKIKLVSKILRELKVSELVNKEIDSYYQFGLIQGTRLISYKINNTIYPLFLDPHNLIYPSEKYNYKDFKNFNYCIFDR